MCFLFSLEFFALVTPLEFYQTSGSGAWSTLGGGMNTLKRWEKSTVEWHQKSKATTCVWCFGM